MKFDEVDVERAFRPTEFFFQNISAINHFVTKVHTHALCHCSFSNDDNSFPHTSEGRIVQKM